MILSNSTLIKFYFYPERYPRFKITYVLNISNATANQSLKQIECCALDRGVFCMCVCVVTLFNEPKHFSQKKKPDEMEPKKHVPHLLI